VLGVPVLALLGVGEPLLAQVLHRRLEVAVRRLQGGLAVHDAGPRLLAQVHDRPRVGHQDTSASALSMSSASSPSATGSLSSLPSAPRPSLIASAMREVMSRTARMASSLPGIA